MGQAGAQYGIAMFGQVGAQGMYVVGRAGEAMENQAAVGAAFIKKGFRVSGQFEWMHGSPGS
jgi:hypothetical protein